MVPDGPSKNDESPLSPHNSPISSSSPQFFSARNDNVFAAKDIRNDRPFTSGATFTKDSIHNNNNNNYNNNNDEILLQPKSTINEILLRNSYRNWLSESNNSQRKGDTDQYKNVCSYFDSTRRNDHTTTAAGPSLFNPRPKSMDDFVKSTAFASGGFEEANTMSSSDSHSHSYEGHIVDEYFDRIFGKIDF